MVEIAFGYEPVNIKCTFCGRMIPAEPIRKKVQGEERLFCSKECVRHHRIYYRNPEEKSASP